MKTSRFYEAHQLVCLIVDNIGDLVPPIAVFWYRRFTLSDFSYRFSGTAPETVL